MVHDISTAFETTETPVCVSYTPPTCDPHGPPIALRSARNDAPALEPTCNEKIFRGAAVRRTRSRSGARLF